jgi:hypothetical protein
MPITRADAEFARLVHGAHVEEATDGAVKPLRSDERREDAEHEHHEFCFHLPRRRRGVLAAGRRRAEIRAAIDPTDPYPFVNLTMPDGTERSFPKYDDDGRELAYRVHEGRVQVFAHASEGASEASDRAYRDLDLLFPKLSTVEPRRQEWLWRGRIPLALPSLLAGVQGLGKSMFTAWLAAQVTTGADGFGGAGDVLLMSVEDDPNTTIAPRLIGAGADLERVRFHDLEHPLALPRDAELLEDAVEASAARLVIIDPIMSYLDENTRQNDQKEVRAVFGELMRICQAHRSTVLAVMHFRKEAASEVLHMVTSSSAWTEAPRSVLGLGLEPDTDAADGHRALVHLKCNVGPVQPTLLGRIVEAQVAARGGPIRIGRWDPAGESDLGRDEVFQSSRGNVFRSRDAAAAFLQELRQELGDVVPIATIKDRWREAGLGSWNTLDRAAKEALGVQVRREAGAWVWAF